MKKNLLLIACLFWFPLLNYSQWIQTDGPYGKTSVPVMFENKSKLYVGTNCGLHQIDSLTGRWKNIANIDIDVYDKKGDSIFYGSLYSEINLIILSDGNPMPISMGLGSTINTIKSSDTCLFVGVETGGFAKSNGFSHTWSYYNEGLPTDTMYIPPKFGGGVYYVRYVFSIGILADKIFCGTNKGVYKSEISDISWSESNNGMPKETIGLLEVLGDTIFACIDDDLYYSSDNGNTWSKSYTFLSSITSIEKFSGIFYITTNSNGILKSTNLSSWSDLNSGLSDLNIKTIQLIDSILVCGTSSTGVQYMKNDNWISSNSGIICSSIRSLKSTENSLVANDEDNVYISDNGQNWKDISPEVDYELFGSVATMIDTLFLSVEYDIPLDNPYILFSPNNGVSWEDLKQPVPFARDDPYRIFCDNGRLYAYEDDIMYYTNNLGANWTEISLSNQYCNNFSDLIVFYSQTYAAACGNGEFLKLSNNSWLLSNDGLPSDREVNALAHSSDALYAYISVHGMYVSKDNGESWSKATNGLDTDWGIRSFSYQDKNIFVSTEKGVYYSDNYGQNWNLLNDGLINVNTSSIVILEDTLYVGTYGNGIWKHDIKSIPLSISESNIIDNLDFYPNPASKDINIVLSTYQNGEIQIFDLMGRKVLSKPFQKSENVDVSSMPNGTYIVSLKLNDKIKTSKLIISR
jgi:hypothetical protein